MNDHKQSMFDFTGKIALAVGGSGYLCAPACRRLAERGASLLLTDLSGERAADLAAELARDTGARVEGAALDLGDPAAIEAAVSQVVAKFGALDILICAAYSGSHGQPLEVLAPESFDATLHQQLTGTFVLARTSAAVMREGGTMLFFSSMYGRISPDPTIYHAPMLPNPIDYGVGKAGLEQMIRYLAVHYAPRNIRVNGVAPGAFPHAVSQGYDTPEFREFEKRLAQKAPLGRIGRQEELSGAVVFLVSDEASFITGQTLAVDGGWTIL
jgi:NAD(P)-dependent dehydrogenase (short-subunit alcohol dehydrogenase family)